MAGATKAAGATRAAGMAATLCGIEAAADPVAKLQEIEERLNALRSPFRSAITCLRSPRDRLARGASANT